MDLISKPNLPEFSPGDEEERTSEQAPSENLPEPFHPDEKKLSPIKVVGGSNLHDLLLQAGHSATLDFLVRTSEYSFLGDYLLIGYVQLSAYLEFRKLGKTYKTEDPEQFKQWLDMKEFGGLGKK
jgi:hypothetical protein